MAVASGNYSAIFCCSTNNLEIVTALQRLRKKLFVDELGWDVATQGDLESDEFDTPAAVHCALFCGDDLVGGFRAIRTDHDYLVRNAFPQLATFRRYPSRPDMWEISRFGVLPGPERLKLARINYSLMFWFAHSRRATALVALADLTYERYLTRIGIRTRRYGPPQNIGFDRYGRALCAVAGEIPIAEQGGAKFLRLTEISNNVDITDETLVRGPARVSA